MTERGVGGLTLSEVARRMAVQPPSLYKYFDSLHAIYDRLFARGLDEFWAAVTGALDGLVGEQRIRVSFRTAVAWAVENRALAQLLFWRAVPDYEPSPETFEASVDQMAFLRRELESCVDSGVFATGTDIDEASRTLTVLMSGLISQQLANEPDASFADGSFSQLTDHIADMFLTRYRDEH